MMINPYIILNVMYVVCAGFFILFLGILFKRRDEIRAFFFPQNWAEIEMCESDNNTVTWLQRKNKALRFEFNGGYYNMYDTTSNVTLTEEENNALDKIADPETRELERKILTESKRKMVSVYRSGRIAKFFFNEGNENPIDFRNVKPTGNPVMTKTQEAIDLMELATGTESGIEEFWRKYGLIIVVVGFLIVIAILISIANKKPATEVLQNIPPKVN